MLLFKVSNTGCESTNVQYSGEENTMHMQRKNLSWTVSKIIAQVNEHLCVPRNILYYVDTILLHNFCRSLIATPFSEVYAQFMWMPFSHREISKERTWSKCADLSLFPHHQLVTADSCLSLSLVLPELSSCQKFFLPTVAKWGLSDCFGQLLYVFYLTI